MITLLKEDSGCLSYSRKSLEQLAVLMRDEKYFTSNHGPVDICFALEMFMYGRKERIKALNGLCMLEVRNLTGTEELSETMMLAQAVPYTAMAFRGRDGRSLVIVARYDWKVDGELSLDTMQQLHTNAYNQLHYTYAAQLHISTDTREPNLRDTCPMAFDTELYLNTGAQAFRIQEKPVRVPAYELPPSGKPSDPSHLYGSDWEARCSQYHWAYDRAWEQAHQKVQSREMMDEMVLSLLAEYCCLEGLEKEFCIQLTTWKHAYWDCEQHVRDVFEDAYKEKVWGSIPYGSIVPSALLMMRTEAYLNSTYQMRRNVMTGVVEYRSRANYLYGFEPLTEEAMNTMTTKALKMGLSTWDKDLRRIVNSTEIPSYDPLSDFLQRLPRWDGSDHVAELCKRIPSDTQGYAHFMHLWLLSMVAHWMGKDSLHANSLVPLLIGGQGCGKTSFCNILLPPQLRPYFNDKIDFRTEGDIMMALSNFALINIDEFDSLKASQQPLLKYLLSKNAVRFRPPFGKAIVERKRYASFIGTTNNLHPLTDPTGSRRFVCIQVRQGENIDCVSPLPYDQLYAQLLYEVRDGARYWLDDAESTQLQAQNEAFRRIGDLSEMIDLTFLSPNEVTTGEYLSMDRILQILRKRYPSMKVTPTKSREVGSLLRLKGYPTKHTNSGNKYRLAPVQSC